MADSDTHGPEPRPKIPSNVWALLGVVGTAFMASRYDFQLSTLCLPQFQSAFDLSAQDVVLIGTFAKLGAIPAVFLTFFADRIGRKPLFLWAIIGFSASALLVATAQNVPALGLGLFFTRLFTMVDELLAIVLLAEAAPPAARAWMLGLLSFIGASGDGVALLTYGQMAEQTDAWRWMYAAGAIPALLSIFWRLGLPESAAFEAAKAQGQPDPLAVIKQHQRAVLLIGCAYFLFWVPISPALSFQSQYLQSEQGWTPGAVADRYGRKPVAWMATACCTTGLSVAYLVQDRVAISLGLCVGFMAWFAATVAMRALMTELIPTQARATLAGTSEIGSSSGAIAGGILVAVLVPQVGGFGPAILAIAPLSLLAVFAILRLPETRGAPISHLD